MRLGLSMFVDYVCVAKGYVYRFLIVWRLRFSCFMSIGLCFRGILSGQDYFFPGEA